MAAAADDIPVAASAAASTTLTLLTELDELLRTSGAQLDKADAVYSERAASAGRSKPHQPAGVVSRLPPSDASTARKALRSAHSGLSEAEAVFARLSEAYAAGLPAFPSIDTRKISWVGSTPTETLE